MTLDLLFWLSTTYQWCVFGSLKFESVTFIPCFLIDQKHFESAIESSIRNIKSKREKVNIDRFQEIENRYEHKSENKIQEFSSTLLLKHESRMNQMIEYVQNIRFEQKLQS